MIGPDNKNAQWINLGLTFMRLVMIYSAKEQSFCRSISVKGVISH